MIPETLRAPKARGARWVLGHAPPKRFKVLGQIMRKNGAFQQQNVYRYCLYNSIPTSQLSNRLFVCQVLDPAPARSLGIKN